MMNLENPFQKVIYYICCILLLTVSRILFEIGIVCYIFTSVVVLLVPSFFYGHSIIMILISVFAFIFGLFALFTQIYKDIKSVINS